MSWTAARRLLAMALALARRLDRASRSSLSAQTDAPPPAAQVTPDPWPKLFTISGTKYTLYQPQVDKWDGYNFEGTPRWPCCPRAPRIPSSAPSRSPPSPKSPRSRAPCISATSRSSRAIFPSAPSQAAAYQQAFQSIVGDGPSTMSLDRLEISLSINGEEKKAQAVPVKNDPPRFVFSPSAAVLVPIDGAPVWRTRGGHADRARDQQPRPRRAGRHLGPLLRPPLRRLRGSPGHRRTVDPLHPVPPASPAWKRPSPVRTSSIPCQGRRSRSNRSRKASLQHGVPEVIVTTTPTELIVTEGPPDWVPIEGTMLLYVKNTTGDIFKNLNDQHNYVLVTGRWFHAPDFDGTMAVHRGHGAARPTSRESPTTARRKT